MRSVPNVFGKIDAMIEQRVLLFEVIVRAELVPPFALLR